MILFPYYLGEENYKDIDVWNTTPVMSEESFNLLQEVIIEAGELETMAPFDKVVNNSFSEKDIKLDMKLQLLRKIL